MDTPLEVASSEFRIILSTKEFIIIKIHANIIHTYNENYMPKLLQKNLSVICIFYRSTKVLEQLQCLNICIYDERVYDKQIKH